MKKAVIVVSDEGLGGVVPFGKAISALGLSPILLTGPVQERLLNAWDEFYDEIRMLEDPYSAGAIETEALRCSTELAGLFSCYDGLITFAATAAARLGLPHPSLSGLIASRNKYATRLATCAAGINTPRFSLVSSLEDCEKIADRVGFPAILKPLNGMASHLVRRINGKSALKAAYSEFTFALTRNFPANYSHRLLMPEFLRVSDSIDPSKTFILEEYVEGDEYSAEILVREGKPHRIALFHKFIVDPKGFLERGFTWPATDNPEREERIWQYIEDCLIALGLDNAASHVEVFDTRATPLLVEVNGGRAGGQILVRAVRDVIGVDLISEILALQIGDPRPACREPRLKGRTSTLTVFPSANGRLHSLEGLDEVAKLQGVVEIIPFCSSGDIIDVRDKEVFAVNLLVNGVEHSGLKKLYQEACKKIRFQMSPGFGHTLSTADYFQPTTTVDELIINGSMKDLVRVSGRLHNPTTNNFRLISGDNDLAVSLAPGERSSFVEYSWVGIEGKWNSQRRSIQDAHVLFVRNPCGNIIMEASSTVVPEVRCILDNRQVSSIKTRSRLMQFVRSFLDARGFLEVQTPFLHGSPEAAYVRQSTTRSANNRILYLRTDPEEYLKRYLTAGIEAVYEISTNVRTEKPDDHHLQEFTSVECYKRFWTFEETMTLCTELIKSTLLCLRGETKTQLGKMSVDLQDIPICRFSDLIFEHTGLNIYEYKTASDLSNIIRRRGWWQGTGRSVDQFRRTWLEWLLENRVLPSLKTTVILIDFPSDLGMSARERPDCPGVVFRGELYLPGGFELAHFYENLTEEAELLERYEQRRQHRIAAGLSPVPLDGGLLDSAAIGMPPMAGFALGIDRLLLLVLGQGIVGQGMLFPREGFTA